MKKSGLADSPFFAAPPEKTEDSSLQVTPPVEEKGKPEPKKAVRKSTQPTKHETMTPSNHETMVSRYHDAIIEVVRKAVKELGKEAATHRFTEQEKRALADIIYTYKNQGTRTSENEIARISVNFIIEDYRQNGKESVLDKALKA